MPLEFFHVIVQGSHTFAMFFCTGVKNGEYPKAINVAPLFEGYPDNLSVLLVTH